MIQIFTMFNQKTEKKKKLHRSIKKNLIKIPHYFLYKIIQFGKSGSPLISYMDFPNTIKIRGKNNGLKGRNFVTFTYHQKYLSSRARASIKSKWGLTTAISFTHLEIENPTDIFYPTWQLCFAISQVQQNLGKAKDKSVVLKSEILCTRLIRWVFPLLFLS